MHGSHANRSSVILVILQSPPAVEDLVDLYGVASIIHNFCMIHCLLRQSATIVPLLPPNQLINCQV